MHVYYIHKTHNEMNVPPEVRCGLCQNNTRQVVHILHGGEVNSKSQDEEREILPAPYLDACPIP